MLSRVLRGRYRESTAILRGRSVVSADRRCGIGARAGAGEKSMTGFQGPQVCLMLIWVPAYCPLHVSTGVGCAVVETSM